MLRRRPHPGSESQPAGRPPSDRRVSRLGRLHWLQPSRSGLQGRGHDQSNDGRGRHRVCLGDRIKEQRLPRMPSRSRHLADPVAAALVNGVQESSGRPHREVPRLCQPADVTPQSTRHRTGPDQLPLRLRPAPRKCEGAIVDPPRNPNPPRRRHGRTSCQLGRGPARSSYVLHRVQDAGTPHPLHRLRPRRNLLGTTRIPAQTRKAQQPQPRCRASDPGTNRQDHYPQCRRRRSRRRDTEG
jgi:hypothetical protein